MNTLTGLDILKTPMQHNDADAATIGEYLVALAQGVWQDGEGFSGKRPFGNSGWDGEIYEALYDAGYISSEDDSGRETYDEAAGDALIRLAFTALYAMVRD